MVQENCEKLFRVIFVGSELWHKKIIKELNRVSIIIKYKKKGSKL